MSNPLIIALSGPPRAGKDTAAQFLLKELEKVQITVALLRMSAPLKEIALGFLPVSSRRFAYEDKKDEPINSIGTTFRSIQIETFHLGSRLLGKDWLGKRFVEASKYFACEVLLVPDAGREEEMQVVLNAGLEILHLKVYRDGTSFEGDSREDFALPVETALLENNSSISSFHSSLRPIVSRIIEKVS